MENKRKEQSHGWKHVEDHTADNYISIVKSLTSSKEAFDTFRKKLGSTGILEADDSCGALWLKLILNNHGDTLLKEKLPLLKRNDIFGDPVIKNYGEYGDVCPFTFLYTLQGLNVLKQFKTNKFDKIVEIGTGYGALCIVMDSLCEFKEYVIIDLPEVVELNKMYLSQFPEIYKKVTFINCNELPELQDVDLCISIAAMSECDTETQLKYYNNVVKNSKVAYLGYNNENPEVIKRMAYKYNIYVEYSGIYDCFLTKKNNINKIYDGFLFFNELDLLEIRLNTLDHIVDKFILVESSVTHSGLPKPFYFEENKERFSKFLDKIIHIKVTNTPNDFVNAPTEFTDDYEGQVFKNIWEHIKVNNAFDRSTQPNYGRDFYQKECIKLGMGKCKDNDIIICSDLDEILNPEILERLDEFYESDLLYTFIQTNYCYYLNLIHYSYSNNLAFNKDLNQEWYGSRMGSYINIKDISLNALRIQQNNSIANGGWHFSYMGGLDNIKKKLSATSAQELNNDKILNSLETNFNNNQDIIYRDGSTLIKVDIDETYPGYLIKNINKYNHLIQQ